MEKKFDLAQRLLLFANSCMEIGESLPTNVTRKTLANQLIRSSSSPAIHYGEAQAAESTVDFIHKLKVCLKELRETMACLNLICMRKLYDEEKVASTINLFQSSLQV